MTCDNEAAVADMDRTARDYAIMRLEYFVESEMVTLSLEDLRDLESQFHAAQIRVIARTSPLSRKDEMSVTFTFEEMVKQLKSRILISNNSDVKPPVKVHDSIQARLPKVTIKTFDGTLEGWVSFIALFDSLIHKRDISPVEKLHYLLSSVEGKAYALIKNFPLTEASYNDAYQLLHRHYDKKRQIATHYYEKLINCEPIKTKSASELERLHRTFSENLSVLEKYALPDRNFMLFHLLWTKLDRSSREAFQLEFNSDEIPLYSQVQEFIDKQCRALEMSHATITKPIVLKNNQNKPKSSFVVSTEECAFCSCQQHSLKTCEGFLKLDPLSRFKFVKEKGLCILCFAKNHRVKACRASSRCNVCNFSHHSLLHLQKPTQPTLSQASDLNCNSNKNIVLTSATDRNTVLFSTARVLVLDSSGNFQPVRALLDSASACNFISRDCVARLGLTINQTSHSVSGIGHSTTEPLGSLVCEMRPVTRNISSNLKFEALILSSICADQPSRSIDSSTWSHIKNLDLADPDFNHPAPVDMLLNANILVSCLLPGIKRGRPGQPIALNTHLGWVLMGACDVNESSLLSCRHGSPKNCLFVSNNSLDDSLKKFWEIEEISHKPQILSKNDKLCEKYFVENHSRTDEGRFVVPLPFVDLDNKPTFSNSREIALRRFSSVERRLQLNPEYKKAYVSFMEDYTARGHLEEVEPPSTKDGKFYYIPHHGILRPDSVSTPMRVVFDASAKDAFGVSLNNTLLPGPKLQTNIFDLLLRFRWHAVVFTGDVQQMYRQILVPVEDAEYQRIVWRSAPTEPIRDYRLKTVTYGVSSAPFQALRTMAQLYIDAAEEYPAASTVLARDLYVDDIVTGTDSTSSALQLRLELSKILSAGGFHLRKWTSNCQGFLSDLPSSDLYSEQFRSFEEMADVSLKILGLLWQPQSDSFGFRVAEVADSRCTKRIILSEIARIYDPLGFLSPVTFYAKYLMQLLWTSGVAWDEDVPEHVASEWSRYKKQFSALASLSISRRMVNNFVELQIHGYSDGSERGYCAVIYLRVIDANGACSVHFCCAKTKVAPLRKLSIPRIELQAAVLLADLIKSVVLALEPFHRIDNIFAWSDSTVALSWIKSCPSKWKTFVANRVSHIQEIVAPDRWGHTSTLSMPADVGSRGMLPADLVRCEMWWRGPSWLSQSEDHWSASFHASPTLSDSNVQEEQRIFSLLTTVDVNVVDNLIDKFSSLSKLKRVLSYCFRFYRNAKLPMKQEVGPLAVTEVRDSFMFLIKHAQQDTFGPEIHKLKTGTPNTLCKSLRKLSPFLDEAGFLRVGGRLAHAEVAFNVKHPLLLSRDHRLTSLIIHDYHDRFMHPGAQTLQNLLAQDFWILSPKRAIRAVVSRCVKCFRANPQRVPAPLMGNLPSFRVNQVKPFSSSVVDYGGPFDIALGRGRNVRTFKGYICVFVCTCTKAVHIELASELSTDAFLAALKRFVARRGRCSQIISDQGRNFVGASNYLNTLMSDAASSQEIKFSFSPPGSPHFNGLAEAGIKAVKTHLARVVGHQRLTYEEFYTVLSQVEATLNSRPLTPLSCDANDFTALTPGHFLTMEPLSCLPEENFVDQSISPLHRWKLIQKMHQDFWRRWQNEYIHTLQQRVNWNKSRDNLAVGTLVLIVNEQTSPLLWNLGRVVALHPGADKICRVATVKTAVGEYKRPVVKLCPLPIALDNN